MSLVRDAAKRCVFTALGSGPALALRLARIRRSGAITILNLHRVAEDDGSDYRPLHPRIFDQVLTFLKRHFSIVTFAELDEPAPKPRLVLSFDDGYKDFIEVAAPILERHGLRANQNVIPECIERQLPPLTIMAADFVGKAPRELVLGLDIPGFDQARVPRDALAVRLSAFLKNRPIEEMRRLGEALVPQFFAWQEFRPTAMMSADEVRQIGAVHELGAHSYSHATMKYESDGYLEEDLRRCRAYLAEKLDSPMAIYAFPNGGFRDNQIDIVRAAGVRHVLIVDEDFADGSDVHRRFTFGGRSLAEARFRALGGLRRVPS